MHTCAGPWCTHRVCQYESQYLSSHARWCGSDGMNLHRAKVSVRNVSRFSITNYHDLPLSEGQERKGTQLLKADPQEADRLGACLLDARRPGFSHFQSPINTRESLEREAKAKMTSACDYRARLCGTVADGLVGVRFWCAGAANSSLQPQGGTTRSRMKNY